MIIVVWRLQEPRTSSASSGTCELATELLQRLLDSHQDPGDQLNETLPGDFFKSDMVRRDDCNRVETLGKKISAALLEHEVECVRILHGGKQ